MLQSLDSLIAFVVIVLATSLLVTILVQILSSAFALRGKNLGNALALSLQSIHPDIRENAYKLAERVLGDPRLSDSTFANKSAPENRKPDQVAPWGWWSLGKAWHLASAIRPEEIYELLKKISIDPKDDLRADATKVLDLLGVPGDVTGAANDKLSAVLKIADTVSEEQVKTDLANAITSAQDTLVHLAANVTHDVGDAIAVLSKWFNPAQDRAQQWFQMHTRILTIACGILLAFLFQLDSVEIFKFVNTNATERAALVASADKLVEKNDSILDKNGSLNDRIYDAVKKEMPSIDLPKEVRSGATNTAALKKAILEDPAHKVSANFEDTFDAAVKTAIATFYKDRRAQVDELTGTFAATGFDLLPKKLGQRWGPYRETFWAHVLGIAITAGLLSLGAPFWYNCLKNLTSLQPAVSKLIGKEKAAPTTIKE